MHELFATVLAKRDLSRAGELFSIDDEKIVDGLTDVVSSLCPSKGLVILTLILVIHTDA